MVTLSILKKSSWRKKLSFKKDTYFFNNKEILAPEELFVSWIFECWIVFFNLTSFSSYWSYFPHCGYGSVFGIRILIRIHKVPKYGSNLVMDPQHLLCSQLKINLRHSMAAWSPSQAAKYSEEPTAKKGCNLWTFGILFDCIRNAQYRNEKQIHYAGI